MSKSEHEGEKMLSEIALCDNRVVGTKQVLKMLKSRRVKKVFLAEDIDAVYREKIISEVMTAAVECESVSSAKQLGIACGIAVNCSVAAMIE